MRLPRVDEGSVTAARHGHPRGERSRGFESPHLGHDVPEEPVPSVGPGGDLAEPLSGCGLEAQARTVRRQPSSEALEVTGGVIEAGGQVTELADIDVDGGSSHCFS
jgi:hypothetical protein